ncbi:MAG: acylneuraminate cytidylyltransferase family protein [bacterium]
MAAPYTALVPMKGHSERVPGKNLKPLGGYPLCFWILRTLEDIDAVARIVVNTDSDEIAEVCTSEFDVLIHARPAALHGDEVPMNRIIAWDLDRLEGEHFIQTHATNPLLRPATLAEALEEYEERGGEHDSLFSVTPHRSRFYDAEGRPVNHDPGELLPTQDLPPLLEENSNFYIFSRSSFEATGRRIGRDPILFEMDPLEAVDIDTPGEWKLAEALLVLREDVVP